MTLVVSPLVALMEDQLMALKQRGVDAAMLSAATEKSQLSLVLKSMTDRSSTLKLLYVTPERLAKSKRYAKASCLSSVQPYQKALSQ